MKGNKAPKRQECRLSQWAARCRVGCCVLSARQGQPWPPASCPAQRAGEGHGVGSRSHALEGNLGRGAAATLGFDTASHLPQGSLLPDGPLGPRGSAPNGWCMGPRAGGLCTPPRVPGPCSLPPVPVGSPCWPCCCQLVPRASLSSAALPARRRGAPLRWLQAPPRPSQAHLAASASPTATLLTHPVCGVHASSLRSPQGLLRAHRANPLLGWGCHPKTLGTCQQPFEKRVFIFLSFWGGGGK